MKYKAARQSTDLQICTWRQMVVSVKKEPRRRNHTHTHTLTHIHTQTHFVLGRFSYLHCTITMNLIDGAGATDAFRQKR